MKQPPTNVLRTRCSLFAAFLLLAPSLFSQTAPSPTPESSTITVSSTLVLVPAMVKTKSGEIVFALTADDFRITDDGIEQKLTLEQDTDRLPLALVVLVETGASGTRYLPDYAHLGPTMEALVGEVPHQIAVVAFDSKPTLIQPFTPDITAATDAIGNLNAGDHQAAILDSVAFSVDLLRRQPPTFRRAILLLSETVDAGSQTTLDDALRAISDTNTAIYSLGFPSTKAEIRHELSKLSSTEPGPAGGCMSREPGADPDANGSRAVQALDCLSLLAPPLRLARIAEIAAKNALRRNIPETVAHLTGGEYFTFKDPKTLERGLFTISNDIPNRYVLSFHAQAPHPGLHALNLQLRDRPFLSLETRGSYWVDPAPSTPNPLPDTRVGGVSHLQ